jgi:monofunctional biosynthetic peptidoglycan transglycosylase
MRQRIEEAKRDGKQLRIHQSWVPLSRIPKNIVDAVIVAEDGAFYSHKGVDWFEVKESVEKNISERRIARGASTITQQLAKNLFLSTSRSPLRKLKELFITFLLESDLDKRRILEIYLNIIEWGRGVFGVEAAAQTYFGKTASMLTLDEALRLAAVIPSPLRHRPDEDSRYVLRRKDIVFRRMYARFDQSFDQHLPMDSAAEWEEPIDLLDDEQREEDESNRLTEDTSISVLPDTVADDSVNETDSTGIDEENNGL